MKEDNSLKALWFGPCNKRQHVFLKLSVRVFLKQGSAAPIVNLPGVIIGGSPILSSYAGGKCCLAVHLLCALNLRMSTKKKK